MRLFVIALFVLVAGCAPQIQTIQTVGKFDPNGVAFIHATGPNTIQGQAFMRQRGGNVVTCAGSDVFLVPRGSYSEERIANIFGTTQRVARNIAWADAPDAAYWEYMRRTRCDAQGGFVFEDLADGDYFITTVVIWESPTGYQGSLVTQGGSLMAPVSVDRGNTAKVIPAYSPTPLP